MKKILLVLVLLLLSINAKGVELKSYNLIWQDEFNGNSLDLNKWKLGWPQRWSINNDLKNVKVYDGKLHISLNGKGKNITSAMLTTEGIVEEPYGYWEIKVSFNDASGTWSDAWLYTHKMYPQKLGIELDIFEHRCYNWDESIISNLISYGIHYKGYGSDSFTKGGSFELNYCQEWHVFGLLATKENYIWYLDGVEVARINDTRGEPLFLVLSTELQDWGWAGRTLNYYNQETMIVEYVRYYKEDRFKFELPVSTVPFFIK